MTKDAKYEAGTKRTDILRNDLRQCQAETKGAKYQARTEGVKNHKKQTDIRQVKTKDIRDYEKQNDCLQAETEDIKNYEKQTDFPQAETRLGSRGEGGGVENDSGDGKARDV